MPGKARSKEQLLDLLLLGLAWLHEDSPASYSGWTYNGVFQTIRYTGGISDQQYQHVAKGNDRDLAQYIMNNGVLVFPQSQRPVGPVMPGQPLRTALPSQSECAKRVRGSEKLLVVLVNRPLFDKMALVTPGGFPLLATESGWERAHRVAANYERDLPKEGFRSQWRSHRRAMSGMHARMRTGD